MGIKDISLFATNYLETIEREENFDPNLSLKNHGDYRHYVKNFFSGNVQIDWFAAIDSNNGIIMEKSFAKILKETIENVNDMNAVAFYIDTDNISSIWLLLIAIAYFSLSIKVANRRKNYKTLKFIMIFDE